MRWRPSPERGHPSPARLSLKSASVLVLDQISADPAGKQAGAVVPIASLTKLMTAMVLLDAHLDPMNC